MKTMKKFTIGMAALLVASLFLIGCPTDAETKTEYLPGNVIHADAVVDDDAELAYALASSDYTVIEVIGGGFDLATVKEIPAGKTVILQAAVTPASGGLTINGTVYVGVGGTLTAETGKPVIVKDGVLNVIGTLITDATTSVNDGAAAPATVLGTSKAVINGSGATLEYTASAAFADAAAVAAALPYVTKGTLYVSEVTAVQAFLPSAFNAVSVSSGKTLEVTANGTETGPTLTVPAGVNLSTTQTLATGVTTLTVNGTLTASSATLAAVTTLAVNGKLDAEAATFAALTTASGSGSLKLGTGDFGSKAVLLLGIANVTSAATTITADTLTVPVSTMLTLTGAAAPTGTVTVNGRLLLRNGLTLKKTLAISGTGGVALVTGGAITLSDATNAKIAGGSAYEITPASAETDGTLTAGVDNTVVAFTAAGIGGYNNSGQALADLKSDPASAATLAFGGTAGPTLAIKGATTVGGVILDVSTKGKITVDSGKTLALTLGAGSKGIASGGIITAATATAGTAVKANAAMQAGTAAVIPANVGAAEVEKAASASGANLATGNASTNPASGVIGTDALVTIDTGDTFTLTDGKIVVTH